MTAANTSDRSGTTEGTPGTGGPDLSRPGWGLLFDILREQRRGLLVATAIGLAWTVGKIASPIFVRFGIDRGIVEGDRLWLWAGLIAVAGLLTGTFTAVRRYLSFKEARWTETRLRERQFSHILRLHVGYHDRARTGELMSRASSDLQMVQGFVVMMPITAVNIVMIAAVAVILFATDPLLALVAIGTLPIVQVAGRRFSQTIHPRINAVQAEQAALATVVEESIGGVRVIKGFGAEQVQYDKLCVEADDIRRESIGAAKVRAQYLPAIELLPQLGLIAVLGIGGLRVVDGELTLGELVQFNVYVTMLVWPLRMIGMTIAWAQRAAVSLERIQQVLSVEPAIVDDPAARPLPSDEPVGRVVFDDVTFGYDDRTVLDGFSLHLEPGESVALVGATGSGKSTVARLLVRFYDVDRGTIEIDGVDITEARLVDVRHGVGVVFEDTLLFRASVRDNIAFADPSAGAEEIERAAYLAGAHDFIEQLPQGYDTVIGERGYSLSGGQRQRVAIARAIVADPRVLVLDDATSAVDPSKEHEIRAAMATVMHGRTTIVIAHRPGTIALADRVVLLDAGAVADTGTHDELLGRSAQYRSVLAAMDASRAAYEVDGIAPDVAVLTTRSAARIGGSD